MLSDNVVVVDARGRRSRIVVIGVEGSRNELRRGIGPGGRSRQAPHVHAIADS